MNVPPGLLKESKPTLFVFKNGDVTSLLTNAKEVEFDSSYSLPKVFIILYISSYYLYLYIITHNFYLFW